MRRTAFKRAATVLKAIHADRARVLPAPRPADLPRGVMTRALPSTSPPLAKDEPVRSEAYRRLIAALPCDRCKAPGPTQAAHSDSAADGKGMSLKACDLSCYPLCPTCHDTVGASGALGKEGRREYEAQAAARARLALMVQAMDDRRARAVLVKIGLLT